MNERLLVRGNEAVAMAAIDAGCLLYFGYPITPQNEIPEYLSRHLRQVGGEFIQAESEIASINMLLGAAATGTRVMTSSSSPGISLMQEGISYMAGSELPAVIVNMSRSGPGLGGIAPSQGDYFQATRGGGHGDYRTIALAPSSVQEIYDLTILAFELADRYRTPVLILGDALIGQMKEPLTKKGKRETKELPKDWALTGAKGREPNLLKSLYLKDGELTEHNWKLFEKYQEIKEKEILVETANLKDAELVVVAFGSMARIARTAAEEGRNKGMRLGFIRPITVFPFPDKAIFDASKRAKKFFAVELNTGQMVDDVRLSVAGDSKVYFYGRPPGSIPSPEEILEEIEKVY
ncbi:MAG: 3-methyl-2-oxobutanoate dehydrogenase subunit VorB [Proteobacteria bacterium]|nr:3-methyl-2-oxobutanoate dehydrogenase subunit VorB [Pseudomonadota bacterium]NIS69477.1 3-methyl-2-oxobutanoate dehydrogenase subunit VorB [Pseudomonadota bacterium]